MKAKMPEGFKEGTFVRCIYNSEIRFITKHNDIRAICPSFEDNGVISGQPPAPHCYYEGYRPLLADELQDLLLLKYVEYNNNINQLGKRLEVIEEKYDYIQKVKSEPATDYKTVTPTPEWEILSFKIKGSNSDQISYKNTQGQFCFYHTAYCSQEDMIEAGHHIHSVRRTSDNTIWTVGDETSFGTIESFVKGGEKDMWVNIMATKELGCTTALSELKKPERKPLFTTEDGVDYFEGNEKMWYGITAEIGTFTSTSAYKYYTGKRFSKKELAEEYVWKNKPVFSYKDIYQGALNMDGRDWYEKQAKLRALNQK